MFSFFYNKVNIHLLKRKSHKPGWLILFCLALLCILCINHNIDSISSIGDRGGQSTKKETWANFISNLPVLRPITNDTTHTIRVKRIIDERLPNLTEEQFERLNQKVIQNTKKHLGIDVKLVNVGQEEIRAFFKRHDYVYKKLHYQYLFESLYLNLAFEADRLTLKNTIETRVEQSEWHIVMPFIDPEVQPHIKSKKDAANFLYNELLTKYNRIGSIRVANDELVRNRDYELTQHYAMWVTTQYETREADLFITNTMIASIDADMPLYVVKRGGITNGLTGNNLFNQYQGTVTVGLFPFLSNAEFFQEERGLIPPAKLIDLISLLIVHEFGHLLERYREYYNLENSVHVAPKDLNYYKWFLDIQNNPSNKTEKLETLKYHF